MEKLLSETKVDVALHPTFSTYTPADWAMVYIEEHGQTDGQAHKAWVIDQVSRILKGTPVIVTLAEWPSGKAEYRYDLGEPSQAYLEWRAKQTRYDEGRVP